MKVVFGILMVVGLLLLLGTVGLMENSPETSTTETTIRVIIGFTVLVVGWFGIGYIESQDEE